MPSLMDQIRAKVAADQGEEAAAGFSLAWQAGAKKSADDRAARAQGKTGTQAKTQAAKKGRKPFGMVKNAIKVAYDIRGGAPAPSVSPGQVTNPALRHITGAAFDIAAGRQTLAAGGARALADFGLAVKEGAVNAVAQNAQAMAASYGIDYQAAQSLYEAQIGASGPSKIPVMNSPEANSAAKAINRVSGFGLDEILAKRGESPVGAASDAPTRPPAWVEPKVILAVAAVLLVLLLR